MEGALFRFEKQMEFTQAFQDLRNVVAMFGHALGVDEKVNQCRRGRIDGDTPGEPHT